MNEYGFAFNKRKHQDVSGSAVAGGSAALAWLGGGSGGGTSSGGAVSNPAAPSFAAPSFIKPRAAQDAAPRVDKSDLEKHADVLEHLKKRHDRKPITAYEIQEATGVHLEDEDAFVKTMLERNPNVEVLFDGDVSRETQYVYYSKYNVASRTELLALVDRCKSGINRAELHDAYPRAATDINNLIREGGIIAADNKELKNQILFPRGPLFLTPLRGTMQTAPGSRMALCSEPPDDTVRRGEAVRLGGRWFRVACDLAGHASHSQPQRASAPLSVTRDADPDLRSEDRLALGFEAGPGQPALPLQEAWPGDEPPWTGTGARHGCSKALRQLWRDVLADVPREEAERQALMHSVGLVSELQSGARRPKKFLHGQRRQKPKRKRAPGTGRNLKITNLHLQGTDAGRLLEEARTDPEKFRAGSGGQI